MQPLSDKDLDRMSREAADQYDVEQSTSGWDKLEQKLTKHLPESGKKERRRYLFLLWVFALLSGGGLLWMLTNYTPQQITLKEGSTAPITPGIDNRAKEQLQSKEQGSNESSVDKVLSEKALEGTGDDKAQTPPPGLPSAEVKDEVTLKKSNDPSLSEGTPGDKLVDNQRARGYRPDNKNKIKPTDLHARPLTSAHQNKELIANELSDNKDRSNNVVSTSPQDQPKTTTEVIRQDAQQLKKDSTVQDPKAPADQVKNAKTKKPASTDGFKKGLTLGVIGAPDMSNVKFTNTNKVGFNAGIQIGYRFADRWTVNTGVIFTRKNYTAHGKDFSAPKGTWLDNVTLDEVEGYCNMFDIPVNVRYDLSTGHKHRYFVSTGLSSYLMKKESYHYYYQYTNGTPGYRSREFNSDERHLFSILNVSAGFERKISKRMSVQAEPYFKVPLTGLGYGNLKLNSYGIYFSLRYNTGLFGKK